MGDTSYEGFYYGSGDSFNPDHGNLTGYKLGNPGMLGFPGSPQTANQLQDTINAVKHGTKTFEVTMLQPDVGESIPKQHFNEIRALMKLTGIKPSVHAPLIDAAGFGEQGWSPTAREDNERRLFSAIEKAQMLDPTGNLPIVIHASNGAPGTEWRPGDEKKGEEKFVMQRATMINRETGQLQGINRDYQFQPGLDPTKSYGRKGEEVKGGEPGVLMDAEGSISSANKSDWRNRMTQVAEMTKHAEEIMGSAPLYFRENYANAVVDPKSGEIIDGNTGEKLSDFDDNKRMQYEQIKKADVFLKNAELSFGTAFHHAYKYGTPEQKKKLIKLSEDYGKREEELAKDFEKGIPILMPLKKKRILDESIQDLQKITSYKAPELFKLSEDFAMDKAAETFGNLAIKSYDSFKEKAPVLAIENLYQGMAFSRAEDMKKLVEKSREKLTEHLKGKGWSEKRAKKFAQDKIGVTWDVGHLNMMKKTGFTDKDVIEQTKIISGTDKKGGDKSMVKHIHLTDNFGYADTHLVPGMGNVPTKAILEELEKTGQFDKMSKIVEAGGLIQHFKKLPHSMTLAALGSPIYGMSSAGSWNESIEMHGSYFGGYGTLNPQTHHSYFGAGFTTMPAELGGNMQGGQSRFGGTPMA